ncbi:MAG: hypothetical protein COY39_04225 [Alphaproteobacteria bacterium CG_4_10_14_0_8_um_filter_37_21]|nr:MAG: hypothetical protein COY39_04225 [Alphaproteobacteria bacterium CG_4_10_14_0_8_um_filter_37_21]
MNLNHKIRKGNKIMSANSKVSHEKNRLFLIATVVSCAFLSSCTSYEESFSTEPGTGSGWKSMSDTYTLGNAKDKQTVDQEQTPKSTQPLAVSYMRDTDAAQRDTLYCAGKSESIERRPEEYLRVWVAPYQDTAGNMVEGYYVRSLMKQGQWVVTSAAGASNTSEQNCGVSS